MHDVAWAVLGIGFFILLGALWYLTDRPETMSPAPHEAQTLSMIVRSPAFNHEERIPSKYTCDGEDISPPLAIDNIPQGTQSLVLIVDDPDAPGRTWDHWVLYNVPGNTTRIGEGGVPLGEVGSNSWGRTSYGGPCPPENEHRYMFKVYALDSMLQLEPGAHKEEVLRAVEGHVLESATLMGRYSRLPETP